MQAFIQSLLEFGPTDEIQELFNAQSYASVRSLMFLNYAVHELIKCYVSSNNEQIYG